MAEKLIINARRQLGWHRRILSDVATVLLWCAWIYLWMPAFRKVREVIRMKLSLEPAAMEVFETIDPISVRNSLTLLLGTCALLLLWTLLPKGRVTRSHAVTTLDDYAAKFHLDPAEITAGRTSRVAVVHYADDGTVQRIETRA